MTGLLMIGSSSFFIKNTHVETRNLLGNCLGCLKIYDINGKVTYNDSEISVTQTVPYYTEAVLTCNAGYVLKNLSENTAQCTSLMEWNHPLTYCICKPMTNPANGFFTYNNIRTTDTYKETAEFQCDDGFALKDPAKNTAECKLGNGNGFITNDTVIEMHCQHSRDLDWNPYYLHRMRQEFARRYQWVY